MRAPTLILAMALLLFAAAPASAAGQWTDDLPRKMGNCQLLPPSYVDGTGLTRFISYFTPKGMAYGIKTQDGKTFDLSSQALGGQTSVPIQSGIPLDQVKRVLETKCAE
ncbi:hypothetical protein [Maridesulfovibrio salexigens]|uniref:Uncharacterized protein n=1 Tax=Maridesulfovibrio salexigens (strain ATCC 14822 / DSM 2638 / NCIMB 8403 / VKM B-1763) TaxID=526222 RepID=C6BZK9_MARSD|nr:hypothetical protein [Maridesulfovibrio salexigens]ACS80846.1 hypothetical protein Desal_2794 [Maridesulfovibrio salexigens DSM 2638]